MSANSSSTKHLLIVIYRPGSLAASSLFFQEYDILPGADLVQHVDCLFDAPLVARKWSYSRRRHHAPHTNSQRRGRSTGDVRSLRHHRRAVMLSRCVSSVINANYWQATFNKCTDSKALWRKLNGAISRFRPVSHCRTVCRLLQ